MINPNSLPITSTSDNVKKQQSDHSPSDDDDKVQWPLIRQIDENDIASHTDTEKRYSDEAEQTLCRMRWFLLIVISLWLFCAIAGTIMVFLRTMSPASLALFTTLAPPTYILYWIVKRTFPEPESITKLRIEKDTERLTFKLPRERH